jgi:hypothetical protein
MKFGNEMMWRALLGALTIFAFTSANAATDLVSANWVSAHQDEDDTNYKSPNSVRGMMAHGLVSGSIFLEGRNAACVGSKMEQEAVDKAIGDKQSEFWFFSTKFQAVMLSRDVSIDETKPCAQALKYTADIQRAFIADGIVHMFHIPETETFGFSESRRLNEEKEGDSPYSPSILTLLSRVPLKLKHRRYRRKIDMNAAQCTAFSSTVWSENCVLVGSGFSKGMLVVSRGGGDEGDYQGFEIDKIDTNAKIDGRMFELDRTWRLK